MNLQMFTTTFGSAAVIAAVATIFYSFEWRSKLHKEHKTWHRILVAVLFGALSAYASASGFAVPLADGTNALCTARDLAPIYAGLVAGPIGGIGAAVIGAAFRYFVYGGTAALPCALACLIAGVLGSVFHIVIEKIARYTVSVGVVATLLSEVLHLALLYTFNLSAVADAIALPMILANVLGMIFCLYMYKRCHPDNISK